MCSRQSRSCWPGRFSQQAKAPVPSYQNSGLGLERSFVERSQIRQQQGCETEAFGCRSAGRGQRSSAVGSRVSAMAVWNATGWIATGAGRALVRASWLCSLVWLVSWVSQTVRAAEPVLPGTERLTVEQPVDEWMVAGITRFAQRELLHARGQREQRWLAELRSMEAFAASLGERRERLRAAVGAVDQRTTTIPPDLRQPVDGVPTFELISTLSRSSIRAETELVTVHAVRWPVLEGVTAEGLLLMPRQARAAVIALPDADWTPEQFSGLSEGLPATVTFTRQLAAAGCLVVIPTLISRETEQSGHPDVGYTNQPHREFLYRQAFEVGRHVIGYEVQKVLAAVDLLERFPGSESGPLSVGVVGVGEGGLLALHAAACDPRIRAVWVAGYFAEREGVWREPIYRNVWRLLTEFGDAELAAMIAPRPLVIEACRAAEIAGPPVPKDGQRATAAPGSIDTPTLTAVQREYERAAGYYRQWGDSAALQLVVSGEQGNGFAGTPAAYLAFTAGLGIAAAELPPPATWNVPVAERRSVEANARLASARQAAQFAELQSHVQRLIERSAKVRDARWLPTPTSVSAWQERSRDLRQTVHDQLIGRLVLTPCPPRPRSRLVQENSTYITYEIVLDVADDLIAAGLLLVPQDKLNTGPRPLIVCQHGLEGTPGDTISREPRPYASYKAFSEELVKRGFVVYAPQNPYRGGDRFRTLQRLSNPLGRTLFSYIIAQHQQTLNWLATLPQVDSQRIAFYGLSYGGKTAMRVPPLVDRYALAICSGDFTDWVRTIASNQDRYSYAFTTEYEIPEWNLAHLAGYAELAMLMAPRPFMVEAGHRDGGQPSELVAGEFGKVRRHYDQLGLPDRAELEFFDGPHTIHGVGTFRFLQQQLNWPPTR